MKVQKNELIEDLIDRTRRSINAIEKFNNWSDEQLNWKASPQSWSVLECMEHLNRYGRFYIPEIKQRMTEGKKWANRSDFKSGWLGNYFAKSMLPKEQLNKMKTFQSMNPVGSQLTRAVLEELMQQERQLLDLLSEARKLDLVKIKTGISISRWIKLRLGDTFRVVIYHIDRHVEQMRKVAKAQGV